MILRIALVIGLCLLLVVGIATAQNPQKEKAAVASAEKWLAAVDQGKYLDSWQEAAVYFKNAVTKEQWEQSMLSFRKPLGRLVSRKVKSTLYRTTLPGAPDGEYVVITFETAFENKASAVETVTPMLEKDGKWRVTGYFIK
ncbi:MAG: DUF4019 domain-containing protein [Deltaproteobacteria bacterium]|nr:DUF4019 domain-containing protein [Deltaproteobacteria bacterium]